MAIDGLKSALRVSESGLDNIKNDYADLFVEMGPAAYRTHEEAIESVHRLMKLAEKHRLNYERDDTKVKAVKAASNKERKSLLLAKTDEQECYRCVLGQA